MRHERQRLRVAAIDRAERAVELEGSGALPYDVLIIATGSAPRLLGIPGSVVPFSLVPVGRPAGRKPRADRYDPARVHRGRW